MFPMLRPLALAFALLAQTVSAAPRSIDTAQGPVRFEAPPQRVAVFDVAALDTLAALGIRPAGTVRPVFVDYLDEAIRDAAALGTLFDPDLEALHALQPDLIILGSRSAAEAGRMAGLAPVIDMSIWQDSYAEGLARLRAYGRLFDREAEAAALEAALQDRVARARAALAGQGRGLILLANGPKISAFGPAGRFGWLHRALDLPPAAPEIGDTTHGEAISFEFLRQTDPEILLVIDRTAAVGQAGPGALATLDNALVHETRAWREGRVIVLNAADIYVAGGGIQSMIRTLDTILAALGEG